MAEKAKPVEREDVKANPREEPAKEAKQPEKPREAKPAENPSPEKPKQPEKPKAEPAMAAKPAKPDEKPAEPRQAERPGPDTKPNQEPEGGISAKQVGMKALLFNRWDLSEVKVSDPGLRSYINVSPIMVPRTGGKYGSGAFQKEKVHIVERFMNKLMVSGHRGRKHKITSGKNVGKTAMLYSTMKDAFSIIEKKTKQNPVQVLVNAVENSALLEEVASYRLGGIIARNSVITSPSRRLDLALRHLTQGIYRTSFRSRQSLAGVIADELIAASNNDPKSFAVSERNRMEKEAEGAR